MAIVAAILAALGVSMLAQARESLALINRRRG